MKRQKMRIRTPNVLWVSGVLLVSGLVAGHIFAVILGGVVFIAILAMTIIFNIFNSK
ncbi:hypothetical protein [Syntrophotalea acetylenica]|uniref:hypothetical protein n=1 Tax=Syntrophotalea acetylenica TaxID=29542 RepID=UPI0013146225|nr:hypothetical protein [Syntrophotalea acetylenica]